jgi:hypothetical protein
MQHVGFSDSVIDIENITCAGPVRVTQMGSHHIHAHLDGFHLKPFPPLVGAISVTRTCAAVTHGMPVVQHLNTGVVRGELMPMFAMGPLGVIVLTLVTFIRLMGIPAKIGQPNIVTNTVTVASLKPVGAQATKRFQDKTMHQKHVPTAQWNNRILMAADRRLQQSAAEAGSSSISAVNRSIQ